MKFKVAALNISRAKLAELIGLAPGDEVVGAHVDLTNGGMVLMVAGDRFPEAPMAPAAISPVHNAVAPQKVEISFRKGEIEIMPVRKIIASYGGTEWTLTRAEIVNA